MLLSPIDGVELGVNESSLLIPVTNEDTVTLSTSLPFRRRFNYTVLAHGCEKHPVTDALEISNNTVIIIIYPQLLDMLLHLGTHDVQNISVASPLPNIIRITGEFIQDSTSTGLLAVISPLDSKHGPINHSIPRESNTSLRLRVKDAHVSGGEYSISVFVVDESRLPFTRTASKPITVSVYSGK